MSDSMDKAISEIRGLSEERERDARLAELRIRVAGELQRFGDYRPLPWNRFVKLLSEDCLVQMDEAFSRMLEEDSE